MRLAAAGPASAPAQATSATDIGNLLKRTAVGTTVMSIGSYTTKVSTGHALFNVGAGDSQDRALMHTQIAGAVQTLWEGVENTENLAKAVCTFVHGTQCGMVAALINPSHPNAQTCSVIPALQWPRQKYTPGHD